MRYNSTWHNDIPAATCVYLASVKMVSKDGRLLITYIDGNKFKSRSNYVNHACNPNDIFSIWCTEINKHIGLCIKSKSVIAAGDEVFIDYGADILNYIVKGKGGCKCVVCYTPSNKYLFVVGYIFQCSINCVVTTFIIQFDCFDTKSHYFP